MLRRAEPATSARFVLEAKSRASPCPSAPGSAPPASGPFAKPLSTSSPTAPRNSLAPAAAVMSPGLNHLAGSVMVPWGTGGDVCASVIRLGAFSQFDLFIQNQSLDP